MEPLLVVENVSRLYGASRAVNSASFLLHEGRVTCLLGPSGCGKSTLLRLISGLEPVDNGEIRIAGRVVSTPASRVPPENRGVGLVFQDNALFPHIDVRGNVGFGLRKLPSAQREERILRLLDQLHIGQLANAWPSTLSGGEQQRVAIARALAREPSLLLLDEPFSGLDGHLRESVRRSLLADLRRTGTTVLIVTHDPDEAMTIADDLILMADGRILQVGSPEQCYRQPVSATAARLLGDIVLLPGRIEDEQFVCASCKLPALGLKDGSAQLGFRPESLFLAPEGMPATVVEVRFIGGSLRASLDLAGIPVNLRVMGDPLEPGMTVYLGCNAGAAVIFPT